MWCLGLADLFPMRENIVAARNDHMVDIGKFLFQVFHRLPVVWIVRLVVHILRNHIGFQEILNAPAVVTLALLKDLVKAVLPAATSPAGSVMTALFGYKQLLATPVLFDVYKISSINNSSSADFFALFREIADCHVFLLCLCNLCYRNTRRISFHRIPHTCSHLPIRTMSIKRARSLSLVSDMNCGRSR